MTNRHLQLAAERAPCCFQVCGGARRQSSGECFTWCTDGFLRCSQMWHTPTIFLVTVQLMYFPTTVVCQFMYFSFVFSHFLPLNVDPSVPYSTCIVVSSKFSKLLTTCSWLTDNFSLPLGPSTSQHQRDPIPRPLVITLNTYKAPVGWLLSDVAFVI